MAGFYYYPLGTRGIKILADLYEVPLWRLDCYTCHQTVNGEEEGQRERRKEKEDSMGEETQVYFIF